MQSEVSIPALCNFYLLISAASVDPAGNTVSRMLPIIIGGMQKTFNSKKMAAKYLPLSWRFLWDDLMRVPCTCVALDFGLM